MSSVASSADGLKVTRHPSKCSADLDALRLPRTWLFSSVTKAFLGHHIMSYMRPSFHLQM